MLVLFLLLSLQLLLFFADPHDDTTVHTGNSIGDVDFAPYASLSYCCYLCA